MKHYVYMNCTPPGYWERMPNQILGIPGEWVAATVMFDCDAENINEADALAKKAGFEPFKLACSITKKGVE